MNSLRNVLAASRICLAHTTIPRRYLQKEIREKLKEKLHSKHLALEYFDFFYGSVFGSEWNKMRLAMLTESKYVALVNNYSDVGRTLKRLEDQTSVDIFDFALKYEIARLSGKRGKERLEHLQRLKIPPALKVYGFDNGQVTKFDSPEANEWRLLGKVTCRDINAGRIERLKRMLRSYIRQEELDRLVEIEFNSEKGGVHKEAFDKVLVDVPCTNDKRSLKEEEKNNIFAKRRIEERTELPAKQAALLRQAIESCKVNGTIVYSTCSLSPMQNEGVINGVLQSYATNGKFRLQVESLDYLKTNLNYFFSFSDKCKVGLLVQPEICKNYGPFYLCKISKLPK